MEDALKFARDTYVDVNIFEKEHKARLDKLSVLPGSCWESAEALKKQKDIYLKYGVFSEGMLEWIISYLKGFKDKTLREDIGNNEKEIMKLVNRFFHCG